MGYRELLKKYIRHLEIYAGDNFIEAPNREPLLTKRDLGELRAIAAEITREDWSGRAVDRVENYNYRLRVLMNRYTLTVPDAAALIGVDAETVRRWRMGPRSDRYLAMSERQFSEFENALDRWLNSEAG